nr:hypothetical protein [Tanacetum cinerariifolium]
MSKVIALGMYKLDLEPLSPKFPRNRDAYVDYLKHTRDHADTLRDIVEHVRALRPLDSVLDSAWMYKLDLEPLSPKFPRNRDAYVDYLKHTRDHDDTLRDIVEHVRALRPLDSVLDSACRLNCPLVSGLGTQALTYESWNNQFTAVQNPPFITPYISPTKNDLDRLFQPMFDEYFNPPPSVVFPVLVVAALRHADPTGSPLSTSIMMHHQIVLHQQHKKHSL